MPIRKNVLPDERYRSVWKSVENDVAKRFYLVELRERDPERFERLVRDFPRKPIPSLPSSKGKMSFSTSDEKAFGQDMRWLERQAQDAARNVGAFRDLQNRITRNRSVFVSLNRSINSGQRSCDKNGGVVISINPENFMSCTGSSAGNDRVKQRRLQDLFDCLRFEMINADRIDELETLFIEKIEDGSLKSQALSMPEMSRDRAPLTIAELVNPLIALDKTWTYDVMAARLQERAEYPTWKQDVDLAKKMNASRFAAKESVEKKFNFHGKMERPPADNEDACINFQAITGHFGCYVYEMHQDRHYTEENDETISNKWVLLDKNVGVFHELSGGTGNSLDDAREKNFVTAEADHHLLTHNYTAGAHPDTPEQEVDDLRNMLIGIALKNEVRRRYMASSEVIAAICCDDVAELRFDPDNHTLQEDRNALGECYSIALGNDDEKVLTAFQKAVTDLFPCVDHDILRQYSDHNENSMQHLLDTHRDD